MYLKLQNIACNLVYFGYQHVVRVEEWSLDGFPGL